VDLLIGHADKFTKLVLVQTQGHPAFADPRTD
jgi:hypothetical protein